MERSIKAKIIAAATADPFLTVSELAAKAGTTARYVRTVLSEAELSLRTLRREYATSLKRALALEKPDPDGVVPTPELRIAQLSASRAQEHHGHWLGQELFRASALLKRGPLACYVELITPHSLNVPRHYSSLRELLPDTLVLEVGSQRAEIIQNSHYAKLLGLSSQSQLLELVTTLWAQQTPAALERRYFGLQGLVLEWSRGQEELLLSNNR